MDHSKLVIESIQRYIARHSLSRAAFAKRIGVSLSTLDKVLSGHGKVSDRLILKITENTDISLPQGVLYPIDFQLPRHRREDVNRFCGRYQTLRPSYRAEGAYRGYVTVVEWCEKRQCLAFFEEGDDLASKNRGVVSVPIYNRMIYFLTCEHGNFRLAIVSDAYEEGLFYGALLTVSSEQMAVKRPTATVFVLRRLLPDEEPLFGLIDQDHPRFPEFRKLMKFAHDEGFFRYIT